LSTISASSDNSRVEWVSLPRASHTIGCALTVDALHDRVLSFGRQPSAHARDAVAHVVGRLVDVAAELELDGDDRALLAARRAQRLHSLERRELLLEDLRDLGSRRRWGWRRGRTWSPRRRGVTSGYSRTGSRVYEMTPSRMIARLITAANTGR